MTGYKMKEIWPIPITCFFTKSLYQNSRTWPECLSACRFTFKVWTPRWTCRLTNLWYWLVFLWMTSSLLVLFQSYIAGNLEPNGSMGVCIESKNSTSWCVRHDQAFDFTNFICRRKSQILLSISDPKCMPIIADITNK